MTLQLKHLSHTMKLIGLAIITVVLALGIGLLIPRSSQAPNIIPSENPDNQASFPNNFVLNDLDNNDHVQPGQTITGSVPGFWFFEASFPVTLLDASGTPLAVVIATTDEDWMVTTSVSFTVTLPETFSYNGIGYLKFERDDPSDGEGPIPQSEVTAIIPVIFE